MKNLLLFAIFFELFASSASALYTESIFDGFAYEFTQYSAKNGLNFTVSFQPENKIIVEFAGTSLIVENSSCSEKVDISVCYSGLEFSHYNHSGPINVVNKAKIKLGKIVSKINLTRDVPSTLLVGQQFIVKTVIENIGDVDATSVDFSDSFPEFFEVYLASDCDLYSNNVSWKGILAPGEKKECRYIIKALSPVDFSSTAEVSYFNGNTLASKSLASAISIPKSPLLISISATNSSPSLGEEFNVNFSITAMKNVSLNYFKVKVPDGMRIVHSDSAFSRQGSLLTYKGRLSELESKVFQSRFLVEFAGLSTFEISSKFSSEGVLQETGDSFVVNVSFEQPFIRFSKKEFPKNIGRFSVFVTNPSRFDFYDVSLQLRDFVDANESLAVLEGLSHREYVYDFALPNGKYNLSSYLKYKTKYGQKFASFGVFELTVNNITELAPINESLENASLFLEPKKSVSIDFRSGLKKSGNLFVILVSALFGVIMLALVAGRLRKTD